MNRQQAFEAIYAKQHDVPAESLVQYRFESKEGYRLPMIASHYRTYCDTLDSIVVELPVTQGCCDDVQWMDPEYVIEALTAAGVKYK